MQWRPIETAPKEVSVLVYGEWEGEIHAGDGTKDILIAKFEHGEWYVEGGDYYASYVKNPTHWMPLPRPPK